MSSCTKGDRAVHRSAHETSVAGKQHPAVQPRLGSSDNPVRSTERWFASELYGISRTQVMGPVRRILPDRSLVPRRAQRLSVKVKSPESLPVSRTAETRFPSVMSLSTSARERPQPSAINRTGRTGIRAAKRTETSITSRCR